MRRHRRDDAPSGIHGRLRLALALFLGAAALAATAADDAASAASAAAGASGASAARRDVGSSPEERRALVEDFRNNAQVLICTEAGAEGLNLQFCNLVVNYDLPWNPQRVEQRIGRCHRYGQQRDVLVINFLNRQNAADARLFELLEKKLNLFDGVFGASDEILGALESGVDFERRVLDIYQSCRHPDEINAAFDKLPAGTTDNWIKPEGRPELTRTLTYSILPGTVLAEDIAKAIENGKGKAELATMGGEVLTATKDGDKIVLTDAAGGKATVTRADDTMANGVIHHTDAVLMPNKPS